MILKITCIFTFVLLLSACSSYQYKNYATTIESAKILDLAEGEQDAPVIYFDTITYRDIGIPFHRLLLATHLNGETLPSAGRKSLLDLDGYQALRLKAGEHNIEWCWVSMNSLGSGGAKCEFSAGNFLFEPRKKYLASWRTQTRTTGSPQQSTQTININTFISDLETGKVLFPKPVE